MTTLPPATAGLGYLAISELELVPRLRDFSILNLPSLVVLGFGVVSFCTSDVIGGFGSLGFGVSPHF